MHVEMILKQRSRRGKWLGKRLNRKDCSKGDQVDGGVIAHQVRAAENIKMMICPELRRFEVIPNSTARCTPQIYIP